MKPVASKPNEKMWSYIRTGRCPFCKNGKTFKVLALHTWQCHGITGYELRRLAGLNRSTCICDPETSLRHARKPQINNPGFLAYDRSQIAKIREAGRRPEGVQNNLRASLRPERIAAFKLAIADIDRHALAMTIPQDIRSDTGRKGRAGLESKYGERQIKDWMQNARSLRTPESESRRIEHANRTMRKYRDDPNWLEEMRRKAKEGREKTLKIPRAEYRRIVERYDNGESQAAIASNYGVSDGLISLIIKAARQGLSILPR